MTPPLHTQQRCSPTPIWDRPTAIRYAPGVDPRSRDMWPIHRPADDLPVRQTINEVVDRIVDLERRGYVVEETTGPFVVPESGAWKIEVTYRPRRPEDDR